MDSRLAPEDQLAGMMRVVDSKMRRLKHLQMLIEFLWLDSNATGNFMSRNPLLADDTSMKNSKNNLDRAVMSFFDLNEFIDVAEARDAPQKKMFNANVKSKRLLPDRKFQRPLIFS